MLSDNGCPDVVANLRKSPKRLAQLSRIVGQEGVDTHTSGNFYMAMVLAILIFGAETWVIYPSIGKTLGGFHQSCSSRRWDNLPSGNQQNPLLGLILWYMYWGQKHSSQQIETYQYMQNKVVHVLMGFNLFSV